MFHKLINRDEIFNMEDPLVTNGLSHPYQLDESTFIFRGIRSNTVDWEMFARTLFSLIFANPGPRKFKVLANIEITCF